MDLDSPSFFTTSKEGNLTKAELRAEIVALAEYLDKLVAEKKAEQEAEVAARRPSSYVRGLSAGQEIAYNMASNWIKELIK